MVEGDVTLNARVIEIEKMLEWQAEELKLGGEKKEQQDRLMMRLLDLDR